MTSDEARERLGVAAEVAGRELKRAYLRAVKRCSPERDPERFALLREAYEFLREAPASDSVSGLDGSWTEPVAEIPIVEPRRLGEESLQAAFSIVEHDAELASELFEAALAEAERTGVRAYGMAALDVILHLEARGERALAAQAMARLRGHRELTSPQGEPHDVKVYWALARELCDLPDEFPQAYRELLAAALIDPAGARPALLRLVEVAAPHATRRARAWLDLSRLAPSIHQLFGHALLPTGREPAPPRRRGKGWGSLFAVLLLVGMAAIVYMKSSWSQTPSTMWLRSQGPVLREAPADSHEVRLRALRVIEAMCRRNSGSICDDLRSFGVALSTDNCPRARFSLRMARGPGTRGPGTLLDRVVPTVDQPALQAALDDVCGSPP
ncbi:MAG: J domain-containing protein [Deltaproteobacteria bacterium]|nr:J domain-containing protein [Deltaproteobacteria bacterium]